VNHRRDPIGPRLHGLPRRLGHGPSKAELRLDSKGLTGTGIAGMVRKSRDLVGGHKAHGRNERQVAGNGDMTQRTRQRSKALKSAASRDSDEPPAPHFGGIRRRARSVRSFGCGASSDPLREARGGVSAATLGSESAPGGGSIAHPRYRCFGIGDAGQFSRDYDGSFGFRCSVCSVMWGSAQADRSIIASGSLPRTPSPAFGFGPRLFRASRRDSSEPW
jgi:hypothetical protein